MVGLTKTFGKVRKVESILVRGSVSTSSKMVDTMSSSLLRKISAGESFGTDGVVMGEFCSDMEHTYYKVRKTTSCCSDNVRSQGISADLKDPDKEECKRRGSSDLAEEAVKGVRSPAYLALLAHPLPALHHMSMPDCAVLGQREDHSLDQISNWRSVPTCFQNAERMPLARQKNSL